VRSESDKTGRICEGCDKRHGNTDYRYCRDCHAEILAVLGHGTTQYERDNDGVS
jgi:hypothetical protein